MSQVLRQPCLKWQLTKLEDWSTLTDRHFLRFELKTFPLSYYHFVSIAFDRGLYLRLLSYVPLQFFGQLLNCMMLQSPHARKLHLFILICSKLGGRCGGYFHLGGYGYPIYLTKTAYNQVWSKLTHKIQHLNFMILRNETTIFAFVWIECFITIVTSEG